MADRSSSILAPGTSAPEFSLKSTPDQFVSLSDFKSKPLIIAFYPADFSPVCSDEIAIFNQGLPLFSKYNAAIIGISVDNVWSHLEFAREKHIHFPLLSDFHPKGKVSKEYGVFDDGSGESLRALFLIDENGIIYWSYLSPKGINPGAEGILQALDNMTGKKTSILDK